MYYTPGVFKVEQCVRGNWACRKCETLTHAPVPAQVIDKSIPTASLLAHMMVAKVADHLPQYRRGKIFGRAGLTTARLTLAQGGADKPACDSSHWSMLCVKLC
nr:transposase [Pseudomonas sp. S75]